MWQAGSRALSSAWAAGCRSIPTSGLRQMSNGVAHLKRSWSPAVSDSSPSAFGSLGVALHLKKDSRNLGCLGGRGELYREDACNYAGAEHLSLTVIT